MLDDTFDNKFLGSLKETIEYINELAPNFSDKDQLTTFLVSKTKGVDTTLKLKALVSLIGLSEERLKRVISLVRVKFLNHEPFLFEVICSE